MLTALHQGRLANHPTPTRSLPRHLQFYVKGGWLLPKYHEVYWIGLSTQADPPNFGWTSGAFKAKTNHCRLEQPLLL